MSEQMAWLGLPAAIAVSLVWRILGVAVSGHIDPNGLLLEWVRCVAFAILAGLVARMIVFPAAIIDSTPMIDRLGCIALGMIVYFCTQKNLFLGLITAVATFILLTHFIRNI